MELTEEDAPWICEKFDLGRPKQFTCGGQGQNTRFSVKRLDTDKGAFAIKQLEQMPADHSVNFELFAFEQGFPMATPVLVPGTDQACVEKEDAWVRVHEWVKGGSFEWGKYYPKTSLQIAALLAQLHQFEFDFSTVVVEDQTVIRGEAGWFTLAEKAKEQGYDWYEELLKVIPLLVEIEEKVVTFADRTPRLVPSKSDLSPTNAIDTGSSLALIDWDNAGPREAVAEVIGTSHAWAGNNATVPGYRERVREFVATYNANGGEFEYRGYEDQYHYSR